jgi:DGQHR domain-containing protein
MKETYSSNDELKKFAQNLDFKAYIFDDPNQLCPEIKLVEKTKKCEIDAVLYYKNVLLIVGINSGSGNNVFKKMKRFFEKLENIKTNDNLDLELSINKGRDKNIEDKQKLANEWLNAISKHRSEATKDNNIIIKKLFFIPNKVIDEDHLKEEKEKGNIIIDRDIYQYFLEILNRLNNSVLFSDFVHFLNIKKSDLDKKGASKTTKPAKSKPYNVRRLELTKDKMIMYSFSVRVEDISQYVTVLRMSQKYNSQGFQRMIEPNRLEKINEDYLSKNETFPNNIIIFLDPEIYTKETDFYNVQSGELTFFDEYNSLIIVDGQHRFFSFVKGGKIDREVLLTLIFLKEGDKDGSYSHMEKTFYKINKTQEKLDPNLSFILKARIDPDSEDNFWYEVFKKLDKVGFFSSRFSFKETTMKAHDTKKSIVSVITYGGVLRLNKLYKRKGLQIDGLNIFYTTNKTNNVEFSFNLLNNYFAIVESTLSNQSINKDNLTPREIGALLRTLRHFILDDREKTRRLGIEPNITKSKQKEDIEAVKYFQDIFSGIPFDEVINLDYPSSNWAAVEGFILKKIQKSKPTFGNKIILSKKGTEIYNKS